MCDVHDVHGQNVTQTSAEGSTDGRVDVQNDWPCPCSPSTITPSWIGQQIGSREAIRNRVHHVKSKRNAVQQWASEVEHEVRVAQSDIEGALALTADARIHVFHFPVADSRAAIGTDESSLGGSGGLCDREETIRREATGVEGIATAGIYHAWALERQLQYATTCPRV